MAGEILPVPLTPLFGREQELEALCALVQRPDVRLVTITGTAGVGKTSLALSASARLAEEFPDGVLLIPLEELHSVQSVLPTLIRALGIRDERDLPLIDTLRSALRERRCLLLLDNLEQVIECTPLLVELVERCPLLSVLVTSREVLRVRNEHVFQLLPLPLPDPSRPLEMLARNAAIQLFVHALQCMQPSFQLNEKNAGVIAEICGRLDGLPLAIELAAVRCRLLRPQELLDRLERRLQVLTRGLRDQPERQQTLRSALDWSYDLLSAAEQRLFRCLAVFVGGCTLEMIEQVWRGVKSWEGEESEEGLPDVLDGITALLEKSLILKSEKNEKGEERLFMLETVREYGCERLEASDECERVRHAHAACCLKFAEKAAALNELGCLAREGGRRAEARELLRESLELYRRGDDRDGCAWAMVGLAEVLHELMENAEARALAEESLRLFRVEGDRRGIAKAQAVQAFVAAYYQEHQSALALAEESLARWCELSDQWEVVAQLQAVAELALRQNKIEYAGVRVGESLDIVCRGDQREAYGEQRARSLYLLAQVRQRMGLSEQALALFEESLALYQELGRQEWIALILLNQARLVFYRKQGGTARDLYERAVRILLVCEQRPALIESLAELSRMAAVEGQMMWATRLLGASDALRESIGREPATLKDAYRRIRTMSATPLSEQAFVVAWQEGHAMTPQEAFEGWERREVPALKPRREAQHVASAVHLTGREIEVLRLMTMGLTNPQIAAQLTISPVTVNTHVRSLYNKLGVTSRSAATRYAFEHHLIQ